MTNADCGKDSCTRKVKRNVKALLCEICQRWWHMECAEVEDEDYDLISKRSNGIHWYCSYCNRGSVKILQRIVKMETELERQKKVIEKMKEQAVESRFCHDRLEQHGRKESVRISGIADPRTRDEDTNAEVLKVTEDMGLDLDPRDISVSHRLGRPNPAYDRAIIVKFSRRDVKREVMMKKKTLKEKTGYENVYVNEDLTRIRYKICKELREQKKTVWTRDGKIFIKVSDTEATIVDTYQDFKTKVNWSEEKLKELDILQ